MLTVGGLSNAVGKSRPCLAVAAVRWFPVQLMLAVQLAIAFP